MATYDVGDVVRLTATFSEVASGAAVEPDGVEFLVRAPDGTVTTYTSATTPAVATDVPGTYTLALDSLSVGTWRYRVQSTGSGQAAAEGVFVVRKRWVPAS